MIFTAEGNWCKVRYFTVDKTCFLYRELIFANSIRGSFYIDVLEKMNLILGTCFCFRCKYTWLIFFPLSRMQSHPLRPCLLLNSVIQPAHEYDRYYHVKVVPWGFHWVKFNICLPLKLFNYHACLATPAASVLFYLFQEKAKGSIYLCNYSKFVSFQMDKTLFDLISIYSKTVHQSSFSNRV